MDPIISGPPVVGAVQMYFVDQPDIEIHYTGVAVIKKIHHLNPKFIIFNTKFIIATPA